MSTSCSGELKMNHPYNWHVHHSWCFRHVFQSGDIDINNRNVLFYIWNCYLQTKPLQTIPNSQYRSNNQLDSKCHTHIICSTCPQLNWPADLDYDGQSHLHHVCVTWSRMCQIVVNHYVLGHTVSQQLMNLYWYISLGLNCFSGFANHVFRGWSLVGKIHKNK